MEAYNIVDTGVKPKTYWYWEWMHNLSDFFCTHHMWNGVMIAGLAGAKLETRCCLLTNGVAGSPKVGRPNKAFLRPADNILHSRAVNLQKWCWGVYVWVRSKGVLVCWQRGPNATQSEESPQSIESVGGTQHHYKFNVCMWWLTNNHKPFSSSILIWHKSMPSCRSTAFLQNE